MTLSNVPNFFIVGAARSGTTTLWQHLKKHPQIYMPLDELHKEPAFFSDKGIGRGLEGYLELFRDARPEHIRIGEASTSYLTDPTSAQRIFNFDKKSKIIIMLRNPVDRAYSLYRWMAQDGYEYAESFEEALDLEKERANKHIPNWLEPEYYWNYMYYTSGLYSAQVRRYIDLFEDNVLIVDFEDFKSDFRREYMNICEFLGIEEIKPTVKIYNESKKICSPCLQFILRKTTEDLISLYRNNFDNSLITRKVIYYYFRNSWKLYLKTGKKVNVNNSWLIFRHFNRETANGDFKYCPLHSKEERDFLIGLGTEEGKAPEINEETEKRLLSSYQEDFTNLERILHRSFKHWGQSTLKSECV